MADLGTPKSMHGYEQIQASASAIKDRFGIRDGKNAPIVGLVLGSGLGHFGDHISPKGSVKSLAYASIPHFPTSSIAGHVGQLIYGVVGDAPVIAMQGRVHRYEGYSARECVFPIRVMAALGIRSLILTNAAGAINTQFKVGELMLISDHINMTGDNPLIGANDERLGNRFFDMSEAYSKSARAMVKSVAAKNSLDLREGTYLGVLGPSYETPAEIRMMKTMGADAVGMSTVLEAIAARHIGVEVVGISCLTNMAAGLSDASLNHEEVTHTAAEASEKFTRLLSALIPELANPTR